MQKPPKVLLFTPEIGEHPKELEKQLRSQNKFRDAEMRIVHNIPELEHAISQGVFETLAIDQTHLDPDAAEAEQLAKLHGRILDAVHVVRSLDINLMADTWVLGPDHLFFYKSVAVDTLTMPLAAMFVDNTPLRWIAHARLEMNRMRRRLSGKSGEAVLIVGAPGTAKLALTQIAHFRSSRQNKRFMHIDCVCRYRDSAPTLASKKAKEHFRMLLNYMFMQGNGGTMYFQNVDALSLEGQDILAEIIKSGTFTDCDGAKQPFTGVVICSTHKSPEYKSERKRFSDRWQSVINGNVIRILPLLDVAEDIPEMAETMLRSRCTLLKCEPKKFSQRAKEKLSAHAWHDNIREMHHLTCQSAVLCHGKTIDADDLYFGPEETPDKPVDPKKALCDALTEAEGVETVAARILGCGRQTVRNQKKRFGLDPNYGRPGFPGNKRYPQP